MTTSPIKIAVDGSVATLTIDRPETLNALNTEVVAAYNVALDQIEADPSIRVVIFTGEGRAFIAGGDIADLNSRQGLAHYQQFAEDIHRLFRRIETLDKPTVGAVNGFALGGGTELLLTLDIRLVSDKAKLGLPEINLGLFPGAGGSQRLIRQVPSCRARELMYLGDMISAEEAVRIGLANRVVGHDALMDEARTLAGRLAEKSPLVLKLLKRALVDGADMPLSAAIRHEQAVIGLVLDSRDAHEGCDAFLEKRPAHFTGE
ncbi:enoyl-CoA hydratase/isomerase family protein [Agrobacterium tumefaciens]|uniref:enoyl-CoA hydratase/isomerase family protein n=1 Tax=Agrobacterium tumefaciens TaxID=358 RepID=UPI0012BA1779|nr:enoyl-CoA hydratase-related protein [Agrobacterium tumefaciens]MQB07322.1 enoyl-CoA hydratase/isomerase family protein [Agrobacterium tumefaciens]